MFAFFVYVKERIVAQKPPLEFDEEIILIPFIYTLKK